MADSQFTDVSPAKHGSPHPMASPGYGKRSTPDQAPPAPTDFAHLPDREAAIAAYIDRLPDGADMSVKTLAKVLPHGQCALRTALNAIQRAGHLRRGRDPVFTPSNGIRWVTRTWFSRTPRDDAWWAAFAGQVRAEALGTPPTALSTPPTAAPTVPAPRIPVAERSPAYGVLATLGQRNSTVTLSAEDCDALEPLALQWFERGWGTEDLRRALTEGLPFPVHHPAGFVRKRLMMKMPPELPPVRATATGRRILRILECGTCGKDVPAEQLRGGDCGACRRGPTPISGALLDPDRVHMLAAQVRAAVRDAEQNIEPPPENQASVPGRD